MSHGWGRIIHPKHSAKLALPAPPFWSTLNARLRLSSFRIAPIPNVRRTIAQSSNSAPTSPPSLSVKFNLPQKRGLVEPSFGSNQHTCLWSPFVIQYFNVLHFRIHVQY